MIPYVFRCLEGGEEFTLTLDPHKPSHSRQHAFCGEHASAAVRVYQVSVQTASVPGFYQHEVAGVKQ